MIPNTTYSTGNPPYSIPPNSAASREKRRAVTTALALRLMARLSRSAYPVASVRLSLLNPDVGRVGSRTCHLVEECGELRQCPRRGPSGDAKDGILVDDALEFGRTARFGEVR